MFFFFNDTATTEIYTLSLHGRSSDLDRVLHGIDVVDERLRADEAQQLEIVVAGTPWSRSEEHTSELQSQSNLVCRLLLEKKKTQLIPLPDPHSRHTHLPSQVNMSFVA